MPNDKKQTRLRAAAVLIVLVYAISFWLPLFVNHVPPPGRQGLVFQPAGTYITPGWCGFLMFWLGGYMISAAWLANPLLWYGLHSMLNGRNRRALAAGVVATGLGLLALPPCLKANIGDPQYVPHSAYWTWLASMSLLASADGIFYLKDVKAADTDVA